MTSKEFGDFDLKGGVFNFYTPVLSLSIADGKIQFYTSKHRFSLLKTRFSKSKSGEKGFLEILELILERFEG